MLVIQLACTINDLSFKQSNDLRVELADGRT